MSLSLQNEFGLRVDYREKRITINPFPQENNPFGTLAYEISRQMTFIVAPDDMLLLELVTPEIAKCMQEEHWKVDRETIDGDTRDIDQEIEDTLPGLIPSALTAYEAKYGIEELHKLFERLQKVGVYLSGGSYE